MTTKKAAAEAAADKSATMAPLVAEAAARVPTFGHITYHADRYSPKGAAKARGHGKGARQRGEAADA